MTAGKKKDTSEGIEVEIGTRIGGGGLCSIDNIGVRIAQW